MAERLNNNATALLGENIDNRRIGGTHEEINKRNCEEVIKLGPLKLEKDAKLVSREIRDEEIKRENETVKIHYVREQYCYSPNDSFKDKQRNGTTRDGNVISVLSSAREYIVSNLISWTALAIVAALIGVVLYLVFPTFLPPKDENTYTVNDLMTFMAVGFPEQKVNYCLMGVKSRSIPDSSITASSEYDAKHGPRLGRLDLPHTPGYAASWCVKTNVIGHWIQVDFGKPSPVTGVVTQGRADSDQWVKSFKVSCGNSTDLMKTIVKGGHELVFAANKDRNSKVINLFPNTITCRYIRVHPQEWQNHISIRLDFLKGACRPWF